MADGRASALLDCRAAKKLEPVRLPAKLRDRVDKAQRRAVAAKDGVSIFSSAASTSELASLGSRLSVSALHPQPGAGPAANQHRHSGVDDAEAGDGAGGKTHLPQVVLRHKMREFEAKLSASSALADPLDASGGVLGRLSIEDKERVMARLQAKIRHVTDEVEAGFARVRRDMDALGVFDAAANYQRAQAVCLVELQRRCRLDKLRDEAVDEVLGVATRSRGGRKMSSAFLGAGDAAGAKRMEQSLNRLLHSPEALPHGLEARKPRQTASQGRSRAAVLPTIDMDARRSATAPARMSSPSREASESLKSRRGKRGAPDTRESEPANTAETAPTAADEVWTRHPHVQHAIQALGSGKEATRASDGVELELERDRRLSPADEWRARSASYRAIAQRSVGELWRRADRQRWDSTGHFRGRSSVFALSDDLRQRLEAQQQRLLGPSDAADGDESQEQEEAEVETLASRRQRGVLEYAGLQAQIVERLNKWTRQPRRKQRAQATPSSRGRESAATTDVTPAPSKASVVEPLPAAQAAARDYESAEQSRDRPALGQSASAPVFASPSPSASALLALGVRPGTRHRLSLLERRLLAGSQQGESWDGSAGQRGSLRPARRGHGRESRIGAPAPEPSGAAFGRHSDARMAERRYSAQTWAWHEPGGGDADADAPDRLSEGASDEDDDDDDEFDDALIEGDELEDDADDMERDDAGRARLGLPSLATSRTGNDADSEDTRSTVSFMPQSARSTASIATTIASLSGKPLGASSTSHGRRRASKRRASSVPKAAGGSDRHAALSGAALSLHTRLEGVWKALEFPFSHKLLMVEKYAEMVEDAGALERALSPWEAAARAVGVRERMKRALAEFADRQDLRDGSRLSADEVAALAAAEREEEGADGGLAVDAHEVSALNAEGYVKWVSAHVGAATAWCLRAARSLRDAAGDELQFQGAPYPPRSVSGAVRDV